MFYPHKSLWWKKGLTCSARRLTSITGISGHVWVQRHKVSCTTDYQLVEAFEIVRDMHRLKSGENKGGRTFLLNFKSYLWH